MEEISGLWAVTFSCLPPVLARRKGPEQRITGLGACGSAKMHCVPQTFTKPFSFGKSPAFGYRTLLASQIILCGDKHVKMW